MHSQYDWNPGLANGGCSLRSVYSSLPGIGAADIPWYVRLLENPRSPLALAGAIDLFGHDCIHALLGRGLLPQDEAFVLGFTMGSTDRCPDWQARCYRWCAEHLYRGAYRFAGADAEVFRYAFGAARRSRCLPLSQLDYRAWLDRPIGALRAAAGIEPEWLRAVYTVEAAHWPGTAASSRLSAMSLAMLAVPETTGSNGGNSCQ
jgi:hypothetical protein